MANGQFGGDGRAKKNAGVVGKHRQQLPPQITKITVTDRRTGKAVTRYELTADTGRDPQTGKRRQIRRRFATEAAARAELAKIQGGVSTGTYVHSSELTVDQACEAWLASKHALKRSTLRGHRSKLAALRDELGHVEVQKLTKADLDGLVGRLRRGEVEGRKAWTARSCNYLLAPDHGGPRRSGGPRQRGAQRRPPGRPGGR